jgi:hypothetical protein
LDPGAGKGATETPVLMGADVTLGNGPDIGESVKVALNTGEAAGIAVLFAVAGTLVTVPLPNGEGTGVVPPIGAETGADVVLDRGA